MNIATLLPAEVAPLSSDIKINSPRFHELDSMRGIAAGVVLIHHFTHMFYPGVLTATGLLSIIFYPLVAGHESVMYFFLLSGFVLSLPLVRGKRQHYATFLARRTLRIYGPYLGALILSLAGCALWHNQLGATGWAAGTWSSSVSARSVLWHVLFLGDYNYSRYNTAFWSLVYEMRISIIFPILFLAVAWLRARYTLLLITVFTAVGVHNGIHKLLITFEYAGVFILGALIAKHLDKINPCYRLLGSKRKILLAITSCVLYLGGHRITAIGPLWHLGDMPVVLGAAGFLIIGLNSISAARALNSGVPSFLGRISYSLYLVHGTVLFAMAATLGDKISHPAFLAIYIPTAVLISWGFYAFVEKPFIYLSKSIGRASPLPSPCAAALTTESTIPS